jgi:tetratricopeptide (TPR) repeat protein
MIRVQNLCKILAGIVIVSVLFSCNPKTEKGELIAEAQATQKQAVSFLRSKPSKTLLLLEPIMKPQVFNNLPDSLVIACLQTKAHAYSENGQKDSAYRFMLTSRDKCLMDKKYDLVVICNLHLAQLYLDDGKYFIAGKYLDEALTILKDRGNDFQKARALNMKGSLLIFKGDYVGAQKQLMEALKLFESQHNNKALGAVYINIGRNYSALGNHQQAMNFYRKACRFATEQHDTANYLSAINNIVGRFINNDADSAEYYLTTTLQGLPSGRWFTEVLPIRFQLTSLYVNRKEYSRALEIYNDILKTSLQYKIDVGVYSAMSGIGNTYEGMGLDKMALESFVAARELARQSGDTPNELNLLEGIKYMYKKTGNYKLALETLETIKNLNDSLLSLEKQLSVHDLELMYNNEKAERTNGDLNNKMLLTKSRIKANFLILLISLFFIIVLGVLLYYIYTLYRQRDVAYSTLFEKYRKDIGQLEGPHEPDDIEPNPEQDSNRVNDETFKRIVEYFEKGKPYLNTRLKIDDVANALHISHKTLTLALSNNGNIRFITLVNSYRVKEALRLLADPAFRNYKIEAIANDAGFGSKVSFYTAFSQVTGYKPGDYRGKTD